MTEWEYSSRHFATSVTLPGPDFGGGATSPVYSFSFDAAGRRA